jgi:hypothetical protein
MLVRFNKRTIVGGTTYTKDAEEDLANDLADQVVSDGNGEVIGLGEMSSEVSVQTDATTGARRLVAGGNEFVPPKVPKMRAMVFGNSIASQAQYTSDSSSPRFSMSAVHMFNAYMQGAFVFDDTGDATIGTKSLLQGVWAYSGGTSTQMVPYLDDCLAAYSPGVVFLHLFENDITSLTLADSYANLKTAVAACKNAGAVPVVFTCLPSLSYTTTAHRDYFAQLNDLIFEYCSSIDGAIPVDVSAYIDTTNTYPQPLSTYTDASVHPTHKGNMLLADWIYDQIGGMFQKRKHRINGKTDGNALLAVIPNPCMGGTGGTNGTGSSGSVADSWTASASGTGHAVVASKVADGTKNSQKLSASYSGAGWAAGDGLNLYLAAVSTGYSTGDKIVFEIEVEVTGTPVALKAIFGYITVAGTGVTLYTEGYQGTSEAGFLGVIPSGRYVLRSPIYTIEASCTSLRPFITAKYDTGVTAASADLTIHSAVIRKVPFAQA